jgi:Restriction endonuclease
VDHDAGVDWITSHYPAPDMTPAEFEEFVVELLGSAKTHLDDMTVTLHDKIAGVDGTYDFDATVRFRFAGLQFLVIVEAKRHKNPVKRELVQVLHQKVQSVGANKGVMLSTAPYQSGAVSFAITHGIALATVTEGRFTFETRTRLEVPAMSRAEALEHGVPIYVGHHYHAGQGQGSVGVTLLSPEYPHYVAEMLVGRPVEDADGDSNDDSNGG